MESSKKTGAGTSTNARTDKMENSEFHEFFIHELKDILGAEKQLTKALPKMRKAATSTELTSAFEKHTEDTMNHIATLEKVFQLLDEKFQAKKCEGIEGLVKEAEDVIDETESGSWVRDAGLILAAQKVEHYEIAAYGTLVAFAQNMGHNEVAELLQSTLDNEKATDSALTEIAVNSINEQAVTE